MEKTAMVQGFFGSPNERRFRRVNGVIQIHDTVSASIHYSDDLVSYIKELTEISSHFDDAIIEHGEVCHPYENPSCEINVSGWATSMLKEERAAGESIVWDE